MDCVYLSSESQSGTTNASTNVFMQVSLLKCAYNGAGHIHNYFYGMLKWLESTILMLRLSNLTQFHSHIKLAVVRMSCLLLTAAVWM